MTLAASTAFASMWMLPRLYRLREDLPDIDLRIQTADRDLDLENEPIPLGIRGGNAGTVAGLPCRADRAGSDRCRGKPALCRAPRQPGKRRPSDAAPAHSPGGAGAQGACDWREWFKSAGINAATASRGLSINDYVLVIQAAMEGQGVALGWHHLIQRMVASGLLVRLCDHALDTGEAFYVIWPKTRTLSDHAAQVRDWLIAEGHRWPRRRPDPLQARRGQTE